MPSEEICTTSTSSYLSTISPLRKSLSALTTRKEVGVWQMFLANGEGRSDALLKKSGIQLHAFRRKQADVDARFGIVNADAQHALAMIFHLHELAVASGCQSGEVLNRDKPTGGPPQCGRLRRVSIKWSAMIPYNLELAGVLWFFERLLGSCGHR